jgi:hypothetical protein
MPIVERARKNESAWWKQIQELMKEVNIETKFTRLAKQPTELKTAIKKANTKIAQPKKNKQQKNSDNKESNDQAKATTKNDTIIDDDKATNSQSSNGNKKQNAATSKDSKGQNGIGERE